MIIYLDTETTGLYPGEICQLSYIMQDREKTVAKNMFFSVEYVEYGAYMVHGFSVEQLDKLSSGKQFCNRIDEVEKDFSSADMIISHNTAFDFMFLRKEFERCGRDFICENSFCSMKNAVGICKIPKTRGMGYKYPKLNELCTRLHISDKEIAVKTKELFNTSTNFHDARFDTTGVYLAVNKCIKEGTWGNLRDFL